MIRLQACLLQFFGKKELPIVTASFLLKKVETWAEPLSLAVCLMDKF